MVKWRFIAEATFTVSTIIQLFFNNSVCIISVFLPVLVSFVCCCM